MTLNLKNFSILLFIVFIIISMPFLGSYITTDGLGLDTYQRLLYWLTWNGNDDEEMKALAKIQALGFGVMIYIIIATFLMIFLSIFNFFSLEY